MNRKIITGTVLAFIMGVSAGAIIDGTHQYAEASTQHATKSQNIKIHVGDIRDIFVLDGHLKRQGDSTSPVIYRAQRDTILLIGNKAAVLMHKGQHISCDVNGGWDIPPDVFGRGIKAGEFADFPDLPE